MTSYIRVKGNWRPGAKQAKKRRLQRRLAKRPCAICGKGINPDEMSRDHIVPQSMGGCSEAWNIRPTHHRCNNMRGAKLTGDHEETTALRIHRMFGMSARLPPPDQQTSAIGPGLNAKKAPPA